MQEKAKRKRKGVDLPLDKTYLAKLVSDNSGVSKRKVELILKVFWEEVLDRLMQGKVVRVPYMRWLMSFAVFPYDGIKRVHNDQVMLYVVYTDKRPFCAKCVLTKKVGQAIEQKYRSGEVNLFEINH